MGKEFYNANVQKTQHKSLFKIMKAFIVERFNRILKNDMWKQFTHNGNDKWIDLHVSCLSTTRESIDMWHIDVTPTIADILLITRLATTYTRCSIKAVTFPRFKMGDVRISKFKTIFKKDLYAKLDHGSV